MSPVNAVIGSPRNRAQATVTWSVEPAPVVMVTYDDARPVPTFSVAVTLYARTTLHHALPLKWWQICQVGIHGQDTIFG